MNALVYWRIVRRNDQFGPDFELYLIDNPNQEENDESKPLSGDHQWLGKWLDKKIYFTDTTPIEQQIDLIVFSGIFYK